MTYVMRMSTDREVVDATVDRSWHPIAGNYQWDAIEPGGINIPGGATIIVIAHGNNEEIGNHHPGTVDIDAAAFLALIYFNMAAGASPARIFIHACAKDIAGFTAHVSLLAEQNDIWSNTRIFGHTDPAPPNVPPYSEKSRDWTEIY